MSDEVIKTFNLSSNSYTINVNINPTVKLDLNKYNYYFSLDTISFSKVNCNIYGDEVLHIKLQINTNINVTTFFLNFLVYVPFFLYLCRLIVGYSCARAVGSGGTRTKYERNMNGFRSAKRWLRGG